MLPLQSPPLVALPLISKALTLAELRTHPTSQKKKKMDGDDMHRTQEGVSQDFRPRREERVKVLTTEKESLCLYGLLNETWEVNLAAKQVTPEILEPVLGLNFARDGIYEEDWPSHVAVYSDAWLPAVALYFGARFGFVIESRTNLMKLSDNKDGFLMKHSEKFGAVSWFVKTAVSVLQNQTIMNAVTDSGNVVYKDYIDASAAVGTSKCLYQCHKKNSQDSNKQVDLAGRVAAKINILVRLLSGRTACICLCKTDYIGQLVSHIEDQEGIPKMHMMLLYGRTTLEDGCCLSDYNMENNSTVNVIHGLRGGCRSTLHDFLSHEQYMLEQSDNWTYDQKWLTDDAKRKIHSTYRVIFLLHGNNLCLGDIPLKDIPIYLERAMIPPTASEPFTVEKGKRDYACFIAYLKERFTTPRPIELVNFLNALENMPDDILDEEYHRYLYCYWGLMTSARRSDYMIETGNICKEGKQEAQEELKEIMIPVNPDNWLYSILQEEPFLDLNNRGKIPSYASANLLAILIFMRDSLEHARGTCNRLQMEKIFYTKYWLIWDTLNRSLIERKSDLINFLEHYVTY